MQENIKPLCVVIDTSLWRSQYLLKTSLAAALLYIIKENNGYIGLPEVIEDEITNNIIEAGCDAINNIQKNLKIIQMIIGSVHSYSLPTEQEIESSVKARLEELKDLLKRVPLTLVHTKGALYRINKKLPPNGENNQQFKDSVIWEAVLELADSHIVHFVVQDKAFFKNRNPEKGLADNIWEDCRKKQPEIQVHYRLEDCLEKLEKFKPPLNYQDLAQRIDTVINSDIKTVAAREGFEIVELIDSSVSPFLTEKIEIIVLTFIFKYQLLDVSQTEGIERANAYMFSKGICSYNLNTRLVSDVIKDYDKFEWVDEEGKLVERVNMYAIVRGSYLGGQPPSKYSFRQQLE